MELRQALGIGPETMAVFAGTGDKASLILRLLRECTGAGLRAVYVPTTPVYPPRLDVVTGTGVGGLAWARALLEAGRPCCVHGGIQADGRLKGLDPDRTGELLECADVVLVEAGDDAAVIPHAATVVLPVVNIQAEQLPDTRALAGRILDPQGSAGQRSPGVRLVPIVNQANGEETVAAARTVAAELLAMGAGRVVLTAVTAAPLVRAVLGNVAGVVLAAGASRRWQQGHKLLHTMAGRPLLARSLAAPLGAGLREVVAVTGAEQKAIETILRRYPVRTVHNPDYQTGMAGSLRAALAALFPASTADPPPEAVMIFLADQPDLTSAAVDQLIARWRQTGAPVVAPQWQGRWRNPVLFSAALLPELLAATGDEGGRQVVQAHLAEAVFVPFAAGGLFRDVDTPEDLLPVQGSERND